MNRCKNCRFAVIGDFNQPMVVAHQYKTDKFTFIESIEDIIAIPTYEYECENEANWLPSRGNMLIDGDNKCVMFELRDLQQTQ